MRRRGLPAVIALAFATLFVTVHPARAQDEPFQVDLLMGETIEICATGEIACPARTPICDDPKVVVPVDAPGGLGFRGVGPGSTLCSAASATGLRRVFRITVR